MRHLLFILIAIVGFAFARPASAHELLPGCQACREYNCPFELNECTESEVHADTLGLPGACEALDECVRAGWTDQEELSCAYMIGPMGCYCGPGTTFPFAACQSGGTPSGQCAALFEYYFAGTSPNPQVYALAHWMHPDHDVGDFIQLTTCTYDACSVECGLE